jgi:MarR family transcriptional regulator, temperature-dependent positive regulator of motility
MRAVQANPNITQRELADQLGVSLGQVNYQLKALKEKGFIKLENFIQSNNKFAYSHVITQRGLLEKINLTKAFFIRKKREFELIKDELDQLNSELEQATNKTS